LTRLHRHSENRFKIGGAVIIGGYRNRSKESFPLAISGRIGRRVGKKLEDVIGVGSARQSALDQSLAGDGSRGDQDGKFLGIVAAVSQFNA